MSLRVLHLNAGNMMGGIESLLLTIAEHRAETPEIEHHLALCFDDTLAGRLREMGAPVHLLPQVRLRHLPSIWQSRRFLRRLLGDIKVDVIIAHSPWVELIFGGVVRDFGCPLVFWMHGPYNGHWLQRLASFVRPDFVICNSQWTCSTLNRFYPAVPSKVIYPPVAISRVAGDRGSVRSSLGIEAETVVILIAARLESGKGHLTLLRALKQVPSSPAWKLLVAGAPNTTEEKSYFDRLQREASAAELSGRVDFLGYRSDVPALLRASDIYCQPNSGPDSFGITYVEAMQAELPVVTSALGGAQEILNAETGMLIAPNDRDTLARALAQLISDHELRTRLGSAGSARAKELCDPARQMQLLSETVKSVVERSRERKG